MEKQMVLKKKSYLEGYNDLMETKAVFGDMDFWFNASEMERLRLYKQTLI